MNDKVKELVEITAEIVATAVNDASVMEGKGAEHYARVILSHPDLALIDWGRFDNMPDPDPHHYEGEFEAICETKSEAQKAGWKPVIPLAEILKEVVSEEQVGD